MSLENITGGLKPIAVIRLVDQFEQLSVETAQQFFDKYFKELSSISSDLPFKPFIDDYLFTVWKVTQVVNGFNSIKSQPPEKREELLNFYNNLAINSIRDNKDRTKNSALLLYYSTLSVLDRVSSVPGCDLSKPNNSLLESLSTMSKGVTYWAAFEEELESIMGDDERFREKVAFARAYQKFGDLQHIASIVNRFRLKSFKLDDELSKQEYIPIAKSFAKIVSGYIRDARSLSIMIDNALDDFLNLHEHDFLENISDEWFNDFKIRRFAHKNLWQNKHGRFVLNPADAYPKRKTKRRSMPFDYFSFGKGNIVDDAYRSLVISKIRDKFEIEDFVYSDKMQLNILDKENELFYN